MKSRQRLVTNHEDGTSLKVGSFRSLRLDFCFFPWRGYGRALVNVGSKAATTSPPRLVSRQYGLHISRESPTQLKAELVDRSHSERKMQTRGLERTVLWFDSFIARYSQRSLLLTPLCLTLPQSWRLMPRHPQKTFKERIENYDCATIPAKPWQASTS
jgi:hypothetical protein